MKNNTPAQIARRQRRKLAIGTLAAVVILSLAVIVIYAALGKLGDETPTPSSSKQAETHTSATGRAPSLPASLPGTSEAESNTPGASENGTPAASEAPAPEGPMPDTTAPVITLNGEQALSITEGNPYTEPGYTASDDVDGDITDRVVVSGIPAEWVPGTYHIGYYVEDMAGNSATLIRTVSVVAAETPPAPPETAAPEPPATEAPVAVAPNGRTVYLTIDDGPCENTERLLNILDQYGVKVTFFVTGAFPEYAPLIGEEARRGHTVGVHSYTHDYSVIYITEEGFFADFDQMASVVETYAGFRPTLLRFPGGSSNQKSADYTAGIMTRLVAAVTERGLRYCDWNVSSGDGNGGLTAEQVYANVIDGVHKLNKDAIVLLHDTHSTTIDAMPAIIETLLAEGYTLAPITETTELAHHTVFN